VKVHPLGKTFGWTANTTALKPEEAEFYDGFLFVDFVPTAVNFCKWMYDLINEKMIMLNVYVSQVDWSETAKSRSSYCADSVESPKYKPSIYE